MPGGVPGWGDAGFRAVAVGVGRSFAADSGPRRPLSTPTAPRPRTRATHGAPETCPGSPRCRRRWRPPRSFPPPPAPSCVGQGGSRFRWVRRRMSRRFRGGAMRDSRYERSCRSADVLIYVSDLWLSHFLNDSLLSPDGLPAKSPSTLMSSSIGSQ